MHTFSSYRRALAVVFGSIFLFSTVAVPAASASALNLYWRGGDNSSSQFENPDNWLTSWPGGPVDTEGPVGGDDTVYFMDSHSGATLIGKNVVIRSKASVKGVVINQNMTGTILLGTGSINFGSSGIRMGSGRLIGSGHLLGGMSNLSGSGSFTMTGGIVRLGATNLLLSGSLAISKGATSSYTEFVSTGSIVFNSRIADQNFTVGSTVNNTFFKNVTLNNTAGTTIDDVIVSGTPLKLSGALLITQGNLDLGTNNVVLLVESGITLAASAQATLTSDQNITASGHIVAGAGAAMVLSTNTFKLNGVNQNLDTNNNPFYNLTIAPSGTATLTSDQSVTNILQINTGSTLSLGAFTVYGTGASIINYGTLTEGSGKIEHTATGLAAADSTYTEDSSFTTGETVYFTIADGDENIDGTVLDTLTVTVTVAASDSEVVTLTETSLASGIFRGSILSQYQKNTAADVPNNGLLETHEDTTITVSYTDAQDAGTNTDSAGLVIESTTTTTTTTTNSNTGGRRGGGGGGGGSSVTTPIPANTLTPAVKKTVTTPATTLKARVEARKSARVTKMLQRAADRAAKRRAARK